MKTLIFFLLPILLSMSKTQINEHILNDVFSEYFNDYFIKINQNTCYEYGVAYHYNYYYPSKEAIPYKFMGHTVDKAAFAVEKNDSIHEVFLSFTVFDIDLFYKKLVDKFGKAGTTSLSKQYIEMHGFRIPPEMEKYDEHSYDLLPLPTVEDYKVLREVNWYDINDSTDTVETNMIVRNRVSNKVMGTYLYEVNIVFIKSKAYN